MPIRATGASIRPDAGRGVLPCATRARSPRPREITILNSTFRLFVTRDTICVKCFAVRRATEQLVRLHPGAHASPGRPLRGFTLATPGESRTFRKTTRTQRTGADRHAFPVRSGRSAQSRNHLTPWAAHRAARRRRSRRPAGGMCGGSARRRRLQRSASERLARHGPEQKTLRPARRAPWVAALTDTPSAARSARGELRADQAHPAPASAAAHPATQCTTDPTLTGQPLALHRTRAQRDAGRWRRAAR